MSSENENAQDRMIDVQIGTKIGELETKLERAYSEIDDLRKILASRPYTLYLIKLNMLEEMILKYVRDGEKAGRNLKEIMSYLKLNGHDVKRTKLQVMIDFLVRTNFLVIGGWWQYRRPYIHVDYKTDQEVGHSGRSETANTTKD